LFLKRGGSSLFPAEIISHIPLQNESKQELYKYSLVKRVTVLLILNMLLHVAIITSVQMMYYYG
jgi:hypothetical protein